MKTVTINLQTLSRQAPSRILVGADLLRSSGESVRRSVGERPKRAFIVSNNTVFDLYGTGVSRSLAACGFAVSRFLMPDGERYKTLRTAEQLVAEMSRQGISRTDVVVGLGGGVVGDLAGFGAAVHLRGVPFFLIPTTLLAMVDASVGGKTGVNTAAGKNRIGAFHQPAGVLADIDVLSTLNRRDVSAGLCEMVKHGIIAGGALWAATQELLGNPPDLKDTRLALLIAGNVRLKAEIAAGDERESSGRVDRGSRKVLNLGHTLAHALEKVTKYRRFRHGEAVGHGLLFAAQLSKSLDLMDKASVELINDVVHRTGLRPVPAGIDADEVISTFSADKKMIGGALQMVLLRGIGKPVIHTFDRIPRSMFKTALRAVLR